MKTLLFLLSFIPISLFADNWELFPYGQTSYFLSETENTIQKIIQDSVLFQQDTTIKYINFKFRDTIIKLCPNNENIKLLEFHNTCSYQFCVKSTDSTDILEFNYQSSILLDKNYFLLFKKYAKIKDKWEIQNKNGLICKIELFDKIYQSFLGIKDSIKIYNIEYSKSPYKDQIIVSKNHGIISFRDQHFKLPYSLYGAKLSTYQLGFREPILFPTLYFKWKVGDIRIFEQIETRQIDDIDTIYYNHRLDSITSIEFKNDFYILGYDSYLKPNYGLEVVKSSKKDSFYLPTFFKLIKSPLAFAGVDESYVLGDNRIKVHKNGILLMDTNLLFYAYQDKPFLEYYLGKTRYFNKFINYYQERINKKTCEFERSIDVNAWAIYTEDLGFIAGKKFNFFRNEFMVGYRQGNDTAGLQSIEGLKIITAVEEKEIDNNISNIYPNPISPGSTLHINTENNISDINIIDLLGVEIAKCDNNNIIIPANTAPGIYFIKYRENGVLKSSKIIVE